jgi:hypothetical protein
MHEFIVLSEMFMSVATKNFVVTTGAEEERVMFSGGAKRGYIPSKCAWKKHETFVCIIVFSRTHLNCIAKKALHLMHLYISSGRREAHHSF